jgi:hypothetical protein
MLVEAPNGYYLNLRIK